MPDLRKGALDDENVAIFQLYRLEGLIGGDGVAHDLGLALHLLRDCDGCPRLQPRALAQQGGYGRDAGLLGCVDVAHKLRTA